MKIKVVYKEEGEDCYNNVWSFDEWSVESMMEEFYEDMGNFRWSKNKKSYKWEESDKVIKVWSKDGEREWEFIKE